MSHHGIFIFLLPKSIQKTNPTKPQYTLQKQRHNMATILDRLQGPRRRSHNKCWKEKHTEQVYPHPWWGHEITLFITSLTIESNRTTTRKRCLITRICILSPYYIKDNITPFLIFDSFTHLKYFSLRHLLICCNYNFTSLFFLLHTENLLHRINVSSITSPHRVLN